MNAQGKRACQVCGTVLSGDSDLCPVCALQAALKPKSDSCSDISSEFRFEHYQVLKNEDGIPIELGHGAMGVTHKAFDVHLERPVALKIISARFIGDESARHALGNAFGEATFPRLCCRADVPASTCSASERKIEERSGDD